MQLKRHVLIMLHWSALKSVTQIELVTFYKSWRVYSDVMTEAFTVMRGKVKPVRQKALSLPLVSVRIV